MKKLNFFFDSFSKMEGFDWERTFWKIVMNNHGDVSILRTGLCWNVHTTKIIHFVMPTTNCGSVRLNKFLVKCIWLPYLLTHSSTDCFDVEDIYAKMVLEFKSLNLPARHPVDTLYVNFLDMLEFLQLAQLWENFAVVWRLKHWDIYFWGFYELNESIIYGLNEFII